MSETLRPGALTLAATPIGHPLDSSMRLVRALQEADVIAAEDTRKLKRLATDLGIRFTATTWAYHEHNERDRTETLLNTVREGKKVLLVTDAGMPVVSDPGYRAVVAAHAEEIPVDVFPGPSAPVTALAHSGLASARFAFEGFLPRTEGKRARALEDLSREPRTLIFFESPRRTAETLMAMRDAFGGERQACVARELTKVHEEVRRGSLDGLVSWSTGTEVLGEIVILVAPYDGEADPNELLHDVNERVAAGERLKDAAKAVAARHDGVSSRDLYALALAHHRQ